MTLSELMQIAENTDNFPTTKFRFKNPHDFDDDFSIEGEFLILTTGAWRKVGDRDFHWHKGLPSDSEIIVISQNMQKDMNSWIPYDLRRI